MKKKNKIIYSWDEFLSDTEKMIKRLKPISFNFKNVYGIPRSGLILAVILSHKLNIPMIFERRRIGEKTLVVDDIVETGSTLQRVLKNKKPKMIVSIFENTTRTKIFPDYIIKTISSKDWIVFPWETLRTSKYDKTI